MPHVRVLAVVIMAEVSDIANVDLMPASHKIASRVSLFVALSALQGGEGGARAKAWEGEVGAGERSSIPHLTLPSPPPRAERRMAMRGAEGTHAQFLFAAR
jgi:hypothetical protein